MDYHSMKRRELQAVCKKHNIPANSANSVLADKLSELLNEKLKPKARQRTCIKSPVEKTDEDEPALSKRQVKKVRFSPNNDLVEYEPGKKHMAMATTTRAQKKSAANKVDKSVIDDSSTVELIEDGAEAPVTLTRSKVQVKQTKQDVQKGHDVVKGTGGNLGRVTRSRAHTLGKGVDEIKPRKRAVKDVEYANESVDETVVDRGVTRSKPETKTSGKKVAKDVQAVEQSKEIIDIPVRVTRSRGQTSNEDIRNMVNNPSYGKKRTRREMKLTDTSKNSSDVAPEDDQKFSKRKSTRTRGVKSMDEDETNKVKVLSESRDAKIKSRLANKSSGRNNKSKTENKVEEALEHAGKKNVTRRKSVVQVEKTESVLQLEEPVKRRTRQSVIMEQSEVQSDKVKENVTRSRKNASENERKAVSNDPGSLKSMKHRGNVVIKDQIVEVEFVSSVDESPKHSVEGNMIAGKQMESSLKTTTSRKKAATPDNSSNKRSKLSGTKHSDLLDHAVTSNKVEPEVESAIDESHRRFTRSVIRSERKEPRELANKEQYQMSSHEVAKITTDPDFRTASEVNPAVDESPRRFTRSAISSERKESSLALGRITRSGIKVGRNLASNFSERINRSKQASRSAHQREHFDDVVQIYSPEVAEVGPSPDVTVARSEVRLNPDMTTEPQSDEFKASVTRSRKNASENERKAVSNSSGSLKSRKRRGSVVIEDQTIEAELVSPVDESLSGSVRSVEGNMIAGKQMESSLKTPASRKNSVTRYNSSNKRSKLSGTKQSDLMDHTVKSNKDGSLVLEIGNIERVEKVIEPEVTPAVDESRRRYTRSAIRSERKEPAVREQHQLSPPEDAKIRADPIFSTAPGRITRSGIKVGRNLPSNFAERIDKSKQASRSAHQKVHFDDDAQIFSPEVAEVRPSPDVTVARSEIMPNPDVTMEPQSEIRSGPVVIVAPSEIILRPDVATEPQPEIRLNPDVNLEFQSEIRPNSDFAVESQVDIRPDPDLAVGSQVEFSPNADVVIESESEIRPNLDVAMECQSEIRLKPDVTAVSLSEIRPNLDLPTGIQSETKPNPNVPIEIQSDFSEERTVQTLEKSADLSALESMRLPTENIEEKQDSGIVMAVVMETSSPLSAENRDSHEMFNGSSAKAKGFGETQSGESISIVRTPLLMAEFAETIPGAISDGCTMQIQSVDTKSSLSGEAEVQVTVDIQKSVLISGRPEADENVSVYNSLEDEENQRDSVSYNVGSSDAFLECKTKEVEVPDENEIKDDRQEIPGLGKSDGDDDIVDYGKEYVKEHECEVTQLTAGDANRVPIPGKSDGEDDKSEMESIARIVLEDPPLSGEDDVRDMDSLVEEYDTEPINDDSLDQSAGDDKFSESDGEDDNLEMVSTARIVLEDPTLRGEVDVHDVDSLVGEYDAEPKNDDSPDQSAGDDKFFQELAINEYDNKYDCESNVKPLIGDNVEKDDVLPDQHENTPVLTEILVNSGLSMSNEGPQNLATSGNNDAEITCGTREEFLLDMNKDAFISDGLENKTNSTDIKNYSENEKKITGVQSKESESVSSDVHHASSDKEEQKVAAVDRDRDHGKIIEDDLNISVDVENPTKEESPVGDIQSDLPKEDDLITEEENRDTSTYVDWGDYGFQEDEYQKPVSANESDDALGEDIQSVKNVDEDSRTVADDKFNQEEDLQKENAKADMREDIFNWPDSSLKSLFTPGTSRFRHLKNGQDDADLSLKTLFATPATTQISHLKDVEADAVSFAFSTDRCNESIGRKGTPTHEFNNQLEIESSKDFNRENEMYGDANFSDFSRKYFEDEGGSSDMSAKNKLFEFNVNNQADFKQYDLSSEAAGTSTNLKDHTIHSVEFEKKEETQLQGSVSDDYGSGFDKGMQGRGT